MLVWSYSFVVFDVLALAGSCPCTGFFEGGCLLYLLLLLFFGMNLFFNLTRHHAKSLFEPKWLGTQNLRRKRCSSRPAGRLEFGTSGLPGHFEVVPVFARVVFFEKFWQVHDPRFGGVPESVYFQNSSRPQI